jgi:transposase
MQLPANARTCPKSRRLLVERVLLQGWSVTAAAEAAGVSKRTVWRWLTRWRTAPSASRFHAARRRGRRRSSASAAAGADARAHCPLQRSRPSSSWTRRLACL